MGAVCSSSPEDAAAAAASNAIDKSLSKEKDSKKQEIKLLLLGAGDTGKSTILKQLKVIYAAGFSEEEKRVFRSAIYFNITLCATTLVAAMDKLKIPYGFDPIKAIEGSDERYLSSVAESSPHLSASVPLSVNNSTSDVFNLASKDPLANWAERCYRESGNAQGRHIPKEAEIVKSLEPTFGYRMGESIPEDVLNAIKVIWADSGIQYCAHRSNEFQIMDNCSFFLNDLDRFCNPSYEPTEQDILNARITTTTIVETRFLVENITYRVFDVGGQRSERKKWAPYFDDVKSIIFLVAISSYNQVCFEDEKTNRMVDSMNLFALICNHPVFKHTAMILFMNKIDLFKAKLNVPIPISDYFPDYKGSNEYNEASQYFSVQFNSLNKYPEKKIYTHFTFATDTNQIKNIIETVRKIITQSLLADLGLS